MAFELTASPKDSPFSVVFFFCCRYKYCIDIMMDKLDKFPLMSWQLCSPNCTKCSCSSVAYKRSVFSELSSCSSVCLCLFTCDVTHLWFLPKWLDIHMVSKMFVMKMVSLLFRQIFFGLPHTEMQCFICSFYVLCNNLSCMDCSNLYTKSLKQSLITL